MNFGKLFVVFILGMFLFSFVSAGVGISWSQESVLVPENEKTCLTYKIYNPWEGDVTAEIKVSDSLRPIIEGMRSETRVIPAQTSSDEAIPVTFCFKTPVVYEKDCAFGSMFCKQECGMEMKTYEGEVEVLEVVSDDVIVGSSGSASEMSISAPLRVRVQCIPHGVSYRPLYALIAVVAVAFLIWNLSKDRKKKTKKKRR